ncbi:MAG: glycine cleavage system protein H [Betaproteobacteria bacterium]|nr:glycine cleavage system protein H [Betaproteobacteria bacterium]
MSEYRGCELPEDRWYDLDYCWVKPGPDGSFRVGITDPAQTMAGRVQHATFRPVGSHRAKRKPVARLESGKWAGGVAAPFDGTVVAINERVAAEPGLINVSPYEEAWLVLMKPDDPERALAELARGEAAQAALRAWIDRYDVDCMRCAQ